MVALVTVIYGSNPLFELELFASVLSALSFGDNDNIEITVYTDKKNLDNFPLPINLVQFDKAEWNKWTFNGSATHFVKMHVMHRMLNTHQCPVVYFDTDVIFLRSPVEIAKKITHQSTLMHAAEGPISEHILWKNLVEHIKTNKTLFSQTITPSSFMYNSGVMGMLSQHAKNMQDAIKFAEELYQFETIFSIDQFATGTVLSTVSDIQTCESEVLHYWGWRRKFVHIALESMRNEWKNSTCKTRPDFISLKTLPTTHLFDRIVSKLKFILHKNCDSFRFAYLAFLSAKRAGAKNTRMSQAWLNTCLDIASRTAKQKHSKILSQTLSIKDFSYLFVLVKSTPSWVNNKNLEDIMKIKELITQK